MKSPHLLKIRGNAREVKDNLSVILDNDSVELIEKEIRRNVKLLFKLGHNHYLFAVKQPTTHWRQCISRLYYGAYNVSRSVRLYVSGEYSTDVKDHGKFNRLPEDFPSKDRFANQLSVLREDRNLCDYDHTAKASDLVISRKDAIDLVSEFISVAREYLAVKGTTV